MATFVEDYIPFLEQTIARVGPKKYCIPILYKELGHKYYNFDVRASDVWLLGYPRSGTTLTQEAIWLLCNNLNYEKAMETVSLVRFAYFEIELRFTQVNKLIPTMEHLNNMTERRFIKTHLPVSLLPPTLFTKQSKLFYIYRNPKDVIVSYYHLDKDLYGRSHLTFKDFWENFKNNNVLWTPFFEHLKEGWALKNQNNCKILRYEAFLGDKLGTLKEMTEFLDEKYSNEQLKQLEEYLHIDNFRNNKSVNLDRFKPGNNCFIRKGKVGGWKEYFTGDLEREVDQWIHDNLTDSELMEYFNGNL